MINIHQRVPGESGDASDLPKTVILLKMQVADVSVDAKKFSESAITRAKHRWVSVALGTRWRETSSLWDLVLVSNWDLWTPVPWGPGSAS